MNGQPNDLQTAVTLHQAGELDRAEALYRDVLRATPSQPDALHLLGVIEHQRGRNEAAVELIAQAISVCPGHATYHNNLGAAHNALGRVTDAHQQFCRAVELNPNYPDARINLGSVFQQWNRLNEAAEEFRAAIRLQPEMANAHYRLGVILRKQGQTSDAIHAQEQAMRLRPDFAEASHQMAALLRESGQEVAAIEYLERLCQQRPADMPARFELGKLLLDGGRLDEAAVCFNEVIEREPGHYGAHDNLGVIYLTQRRFAEGAESCRTAISLKPDLARAHNSLGSIYLEQGLLAAAVECFQTTLRYAPNSAEAYSNLASVLLVQGRPGESVAAYRRSLELNPNLIRAHSNLLMLLHYDPDSTPEEIFAEHIRWNEQHAAVKPQYHAFANSPDPQRRLRIGYLSADFRAHSVAHFMQPVLAGHDADRVEVTCYSDVAVPDAVTGQIQAHVPRWRNIFGKDDDAVFRMIQEDGIDVLVDLAGHTGGNRLLVLARRAAPVQVTHLGYGGTTGVPAVDYRLSDEIADPPGETRRHTEELVCLPQGIFCYAPQPHCPEVSAPPTASNGFMTFGSFNNLSKVNEQVVDLWAELLRGVLRSKLLMKCCSFADEATRDRYLKLFAQRGISADRLQLTGQLPSLRDHLALYGQVDLALDSFPYTGATTTCEALWMGVPVVTLRGNQYVGRLSASLLSRVGLTELIADSKQEYLTIIQELSGNPKRLAQMRSSLRERMSSSSICDARQGARGLEDAYRNMWRQWCTGARIAG